MNTGNEWSHWVILHFTPPAYIINVSEFPNNTSGHSLNTNIIVAIIIEIDIILNIDIIRCWMCQPHYFTYARAAAISHITLTLHYAIAIHWLSLFIDATIYYAMPLITPLHYIDEPLHRYWFLITLCQCDTLLADDINNTPLIYGHYAIQQPNIHLILNTLHGRILTSRVINIANIVIIRPQSMSHWLHYRIWHYFLISLLLIHQMPSAIVGHISPALHCQSH